MARLMAQWLSERLGQPFVIENRAGAGGGARTEAVVKAPPTATRCSRWFRPTRSTTCALRQAPVQFHSRHRAGRRHGARALRPGGEPVVPVAMTPEFIAYAKANPGKLNFRFGRRRHRHPHVRQLFKLMAGVNMVHVHIAAPATR